MKTGLEKGTVRSTVEVLVTSEVVVLTEVVVTETG
jgi:hypothetical protein